MGRYILNRLLTLIPIIFGISILVFLILHFVPGDPASIMLGTSATPEAVAALRKSMGLDESLFVQYINWISGVLTGDFGESINTGTAVLPEIVNRFLVTLQLTVLSP